MIQPLVNSALAQRLLSCLLSGGEEIPLSSEIIVAALAVTIRLVLKTILQKLASSNAHYVPALSISSPPRQRATFRMQPLRKCEERQQNSFSYHCLNPQCPPRSSAKYLFFLTARATLRMQSLRRRGEPQHNSFSFYYFTLQRACILVGF